MDIITEIDEIAKEVIEKSNNCCKVCGEYGTDLHHIISGRGKRTQHQNQYSVILLCKQCHQGDYGVHGKYGKKLEIALKLELQNQYRKLGMDEEEIRRYMGGRIYSKLDNQEKVI